MSGLKKLLVVEDEEIVSMDLEATLQHLGYEPIACVSSGEEALAFLQSQQFESALPDLVLMDIHLRGDMDGIAAAAEIRRRWQIPVIYLTAHADVGTLTRARLTQPFAYVLKPYQDRELQVTIEIALARYESEQSLRRAAEKERELRQLKSRFLATAIHDIRNPLSTIVLASELLEIHVRTLVAPRQIERFQKIRIAAETIQQLLEDVLELDRLESEQLAFRPRALDLVAWCEDLVAELQLSAGENYVIVFSFEGDREDAVMDAILLQRIFSNLLSNAVKYSPPGSTISLHLIFEPERVIFQVEDCGIGIPPEMQAKLFQPYQRAANVGSTPGSGLGLSIVKTCVDLHHGDVQVASILGGGTQVTVTLPLHPPHPNLLADEYIA